MQILVFKKEYELIKYNLTYDIMTQISQTKKIKTTLGK